MERQESVHISKLHDAILIVATWTSRRVSKPAESSPVGLNPMCVKDESAKTSVRSRDSTISRLTRLAKATMGGLEIEVASCCLESPDLARFVQIPNVNPGDPGAPASLPARVSRVKLARLHCGEVFLFSLVFVLEYRLLFDKKPKKIGFRDGSS